MNAMAVWLFERDHRIAGVNLLMLTAILVLANNPTLFQIVGLGVLAATAGRFSARAIRATSRAKAVGDVYQLALLWIPGALAAALAVTGLSLASAHPPMTLGYVLGATLFGIEAAMLWLAGADLDSSLPIAAGTPGVA